MAISYIGSTLDTAADNPLAGSWTLPGGWTAGDCALFWWYTFNFNKTIAEPAEVTEKIDSGPAGFGRLFLGYRELQVGDTTFGWTASSVASASTVAGTSVYRGVDMSGDPFNAASAITTRSNIEQPTNPTVDVAVDQSTVLIIDGCINDVGKGVSWPVSGYSDGGFANTGLGSDCSISLAYKHGCPIGTETPGIWDFSGTLSSDDHQEWTAALTPFVATEGTAQQTWIRRSRVTSW